MPRGTGHFQYHFVVVFSVRYQQREISACHRSPHYLACKKNIKNTHFYPRTLMGRRDAHPTVNWHLQPSGVHLPCKNTTAQSCCCPEQPAEEGILSAWHSSSRCAQRVVGWEQRGRQIILWKFLGAWSTCMSLQDLQKAAIYKNNSKPTVHFKPEQN